MKTTMVQGKASSGLLEEAIYKEKEDKEMATSRKVKDIEINWEQFEKNLKDANLSREALCRRIGRSHSYITIRKKTGTLPETVLQLICELQGWSYDSLVVKPTPENTVEQSIADILKRLEAVEKKLAEEKEVQLLTKPEKAVLLLKQMTFENGCCEQADFISKAASMNLDNKCCEYAIKYTASKIITKGYGQSKTRWIVRY